MKVKYKEGTWFAIPLRAGGFGVGLVARATAKGPLLLAYLFGPKHESPPSEAAVSALTAKDAVHVARIADLHLIDGKWPIIGQSQNFRREDWPFPLFVRSDDLTRTALAIEYSDDDPSRIVARHPVEYGTSKLERASSLGADLVEERLSRLLA